MILWEPASWVYSGIFGPIRENIQRPPKGTWRYKTIKWHLLGMVHDVWFYDPRFPTRTRARAKPVVFRGLGQTQSLTVGTCFMNAFVMLQASFPGQNETSSDCVSVCCTCQVSSLNGCPCLASPFDFWPFFFELKIGLLPTPLEDSWRALEESVRRGWVRSIGVTNFDAQQPLSTSQEFFCHETGTTWIKVVTRGCPQWF